jgi:hypothetical protein
VAGDADEAGFVGVAEDDFDGAAEDEARLDGVADGDFDGVAGVEAEGVRST